MSGMLIARAPLRVPLAGGLTDVKPYAERFGGVTLSATISLAARVTWLPSLDGRFEVVAEGRAESAASAAGVRNDLVRAALTTFGEGLEPARVGVWLDVAGNSGLGASGAICTALVHAMLAARGAAAEPAAVGAAAARLEVEELGGASGYHDANISARGGLRQLRYAGASVTDVPLGMTDAARAAVVGSLMLFATGRTGLTGPSLATLVSRIDHALPVLHDIKAVAMRLAGALAAGDLGTVAWCVGEQQRLKQRLPGDFVDADVLALTARVAATGASAQVPGGKIGGYLLVCCPDGQQEEVRSVLAGLREVPLAFTTEGSGVVRF
ncbi:MAG: hypothetical protein KF875_09285 [Trueperaceae bacterium]|nr:hypothetical protein [Trueperaceae bacterium]MCO5174688.1 hypothetical protein [Trueperaceae bacterium]MCW5819413.1 hypothetical protein [Trueperaceae bacterium]